MGSRSGANLHRPQTATAGDTSGSGTAKYFVLFCLVWFGLVVCFVVVLYFLSNAAILPFPNLQRIKLFFRPSPKWGPALLEHRQYAAEIHRQHGTTMGGVVNPWGIDTKEHNGNGTEQKYSPLAKDDTDQTKV